MDIVGNVIERKAIGKEALASFISAYLAGETSREEMTRFLRAVCEHGLSEEDTISLTEVMLESGERMSFKPREYPYADKHSTGGVADTTTLIVGPIVAAAGVPFLKMSGRKLGHTGGTIDKLECFRGIKVEMTVAQAEAVVDKVGAAIIAQSKELVPADKALYKLRDETDTVKSLPLIASSVVSKKLAGGSDVLVLDVKTGKGAFMETIEEGEKLARLMVHILKASGKRAAAFLTDMDSPLGCGVGSLLEVLEAIDILSGRSEGRLRDLSLRLAGKLISLAKGVSDDEGGREATEMLESGRALAKLREIVSAQGGSTELFDGKYRDRVLSCDAGNVVLPIKEGYVESIDCVKLGNLAREFEAAGGYGFRVPVKVGSKVSPRMELVRLCGEKRATPEFIAEVSSCFTVTDTPVEENPLIYEIVT